MVAHPKNKNAGKGDHEMKKKLNVQFLEHNEPLDEVVSDALIIQLITTITRVGLRTEKIVGNDAIIEKENGHGN